jgi:GNAT superfamily N-acetyltransferase
VRLGTVGHADAYAHVAATGGGRVRRDVDLALADLHSPCLYLNTAVLLRPPLGDEFDRVRRQIATFFGPSGGGVLVLSPFPTPHVPADDRWELAGHPPLMVRLPGGPPPTLPPELRILEVTDDELLSAFEAVLVEGFPFDELRPPRPGCILDGRALEDGSLRCWVGIVDRRPVSAAAAHVGSDVVVVSWVATLPEARGRGYAGALTWTATQTARHLPAALLASDPGRPVYARLGFLAVARFTCWVYSRGG